MKREDILRKLCVHDPRRRGTGLIENCPCWNCHNGTVVIAEALLEQLDNRTSFLETHYEVVAKLVLLEERGDARVVLCRENLGIGGMYELAEDLSKKFQELHKDEDWVSNDFFDEIDAFLEDEIKNIDDDTY